MGKKFVMNGLLQHSTMHYPFQLENVSLTGMVIKLNWETCEPILPGDRCVLIFNKNSENDPITISAQAVHYSFTLVALQFIELDKESEQALGEIIEQVAVEKTGRAFNPSRLHHLLASAVSALLSCFKSWIVVLFSADNNIMASQSRCVFSINTP